MQNLCLLLVLNILLTSISIGGGASYSDSWTLRYGTIGYTICRGTATESHQVCLSCRTRGLCTSISYQADSPSYCSDETPYCAYDENNIAICVVDPPVGETIGNCSCPDNHLECMDDPYQEQAYTDCRNEVVGKAHMLCPSSSINRKSPVCDCGEVTDIEEDCKITSTSSLVKDFPCNGTYLNPNVYGCNYYFNCFGSAGHPSFYPTQCFGDNCFDRNSCTCLPNPWDICPPSCPFKVTDPSRPDVFCSCIPDNQSYVCNTNYTCSNGGVFDNSREGCTEATNCVCYDACNMLENYSTEEQNDYYYCVDGKPSGMALSCPQDEVFNQGECACSGGSTTTAPITPLEDCPSCGYRADPDDPLCFTTCETNTKSCCPTNQLYYENTCECCELGNILCQ